MSSALFSHFTEVGVTLSNNMHFQVFWRLCRNICGKFRAVSHGSLVDIGVANDLTFSDFLSDVSKPVGSEKRKH